MGMFFHLAPFTGPTTRFSELAGSYTLNNVDYAVMLNAIEQSMLRLEPKQYHQVLSEQWKPKWPNMWIAGPDSISLLVWELYFDPTKISAGHGKLFKDFKTVTLDVFHTDFIVWHRSVVPERHQLLLWVAASPVAIELTSSTTVDDLNKWYQASFVSGANH